MSDARPPSLRIVRSWSSAAVSERPVVTWPFIKTAERPAVDINPQQIENARARIGDLSPQIADRVRFLVEDVVNWEPARQYHAVFGLDALMLIEDRRSVLDNAARALLPNGTLVLAEVLAGPNFDDELRQFIWDQDGILELPSAEAQEAMLWDLGYREVERVDLTHLGAKCFENMEAASYQHRDQLVADKGEPRFLRWARNARIYGDSFRERSLVYTQLTARAPQA